MPIDPSADPLFDYRRDYAADAVEHALPGTAPTPCRDARAIAYADRVRRACAGLGVEREAVVTAASTAVVRMAYRHGALGDDPHAYHNQDHLLELLEQKLPALIAAADLAPIDRDALVLFCACHDLRQREARRHRDDPVGANEAASQAEAERLMADVGLDGTPLRLRVRWAIAGSTFAAGVDEAGRGQGAFAHGMAGWLASERPDWSNEPTLVQAERLARIAADLDTSNVASSYPAFAASAVALAIERQQRAGRELSAPDAGEDCLRFLSDGQAHYVFDLQRFGSAEGSRAFGPQRDRNAARVRATGERLREAFSAGAPVDAQAVITTFLAIAAKAG